MTRPGLVVEHVEPVNGAISLLVGGRFVGQIFPMVRSEPDGWWYGRRYGTSARLCADRAEARRWVLGEDL